MLASLEHSERLSRALAVGESVGISRKQMLPPMFRLLAKLGVPVRPLHFLPAPVAFVLIAAGMAAAFAGLWWFLDLIGADTTRKGRWIHQLGAVNLAMIGAIIGGLVTVFIRFQALSRGLPHWRDL